MKACGFKIQSLSGTLGEGFENRDTFYLWTTEIDVLVGVKSCKASLLNGNDEKDTIIIIITMMMIIQLMTMKA